jgi:hypothetical protein
MNSKSDMTRILKKIALYTGFATLAISIYFSYDGFDQSVIGSNSGYTTLAIVIGLTLAIVVSVVQFIFGTSYTELNWTLRFAGLAAYVYSIYTNYLGIKHILGADDFMAISSALFMDIYPEPAIAWALGEALTGDFLGNLGKIAFGDNKKPPQSFSVQPQKSQYKPKYKPSYLSFAKPAPQSTVQSRPAKLASPIFNDGYTKRFKEMPEHKQGEFYPMNYGDE